MKNWETLAIRIIKSNREHDKKIRLLMRVFSKYWAVHMDHIHVTHVIEMLWQLIDRNNLFDLRRFYQKLMEQDVMDWMQKRVPTVEEKVLKVFMNRIHLTLHAEIPEYVPQLHVRRKLDE